MTKKCKYCKKCGTRMLKVALFQKKDGDIKLVCPLCSAIDYYLKQDSRNRQKE